MSATIVEPHKSSIGNLDANVMALLAYLATGILMYIPYIKYVAWLAPLVLFFLEKQSGFVRFHAMQAFILNAVNFLLTALIGGIIIASITAAAQRAQTWEDVGATLAGVGIINTIVIIISLVITIFAIVALVKAYKYQLYKMPLIGKLAAKFSGQAA
ncbi:MAG: DUF4870 domain-containing protein [Clostridiaceae bacterium]|nr:DUF4870 domain-containing protein [Clostridiaceae bacterium]